MGSKLKPNTLEEEAVLQLCEKGETEYKNVSSIDRERFGETLESSNSNPPRIPLALKVQENAC